MHCVDFEGEVSVEDGGLGSLVSRCGSKFTVVAVQTGIVSSIVMKNSPLRRLARKGSGAYGVRYHFVIYTFSLAETENGGSPLLLGRAVDAEGSEPF